MDDGRIQVRSFRVVFQLERRIHKIDRWRIPVAHGVPLRGLAYATGALMLVVVASGLPLIGDVLRQLAPPLRLVIVPVALAYLLTQLRADGRPAHALAVAWVRHAVAPRRLAGFRPVPQVGRVVTMGELAAVPDERCARYRRAVVCGPARVMLRFPARAHARARTIRLRQAAGVPMLRGRVVELGLGQRMEIEA
jgi:hypothetical protein